MKMKDIKVFVILSFLAILLGIPIGKASAAPRFSSCWGWSCVGKNPAYQQGCNPTTANAAWDWGSGELVRADLRWSNSYYCYSNWSRATKEYPYSGGNRHLKANLTDNYGNDRVAPGEYAYAIQIWTNMYYGGSYNCAKAKMGPAGWYGGFYAETVKACG